MECNCSVDESMVGSSLARCGGSTLSVFMVILEQFLRSQCDIEDPCGQIIPCANPLKQYDFIIVGGGSAGSVVASRLSEIPDWKVLLIEAGGNEPTGSQVPSFWDNSQNTSVDWQYVTEPQSTACLSTGGSCLWPRGKVIGGTSVINAMLYVRGNRKDYDSWEKLGNTGWSFEEVLPYFLKSEDNLLTDLVDQEYHSVGGYLPVSRFTYQYPIEEDFLRGVTELGLEVGDYNGDNQTRFSLAQTTTKNGIRYSSSRSFLRPIQNRVNLHILLNTTVTRVLVHPVTKQALGVEILTTHGFSQNISATKEVIFSAGTISSPQILLLSGIGDRKELKGVAVPAVRHLPGVGRNLRNHLGFFVKFYVNETGRNYLNWVSAMEYMLFRTGPMSTIGSFVMGFIHTKYANSSDDYPDVQIGVSGFSAKCSKTGNINETIGESINGVTTKSKIVFQPTIYRSKSRGFLTLRNNNPLSHPKILSNKS